MKWVRRFALVVLGLIALVYLGDYAALRIPIPKSRAQFGTVTIYPTYDVPLKSGSSDFYFPQPQDRTCVNSLFPHMGFAPCWYLRRNTHPRIKM